jgi:hypothetical protein
MLGSDCLTAVKRQARSVVSGAVCQKGLLRGIHHRVGVVMDQILYEGIKGKCQDDRQATPDSKMPEQLLARGHRSLVILLAWLLVLR